MDLQDVKHFEANLAVEIKLKGLIDRFNDSLVDYLSTAKISTVQMSSTFETNCLPQ